MGMGDFYEHLAIRVLFYELLGRYSFQNVLEVGCRDGLDSMVFARRGCNVSLLCSSGKVAKYSLKEWRKAQLNGEFYVGNLQRTPFKNDVFDLVWNTNIINLMESPVVFIKEMARVSKHLVLGFVPNIFNVGHIISEKPIGRKNMLLSNLLRVFRKADLKIVERGGVDMPPWPSGVTTGLVGGGRWDLNIEKTALSHRILRFLILFEKHSPKILRVFQSHIIYVLAEKV